MSINDLLNDEHFLIVLMGFFLLVFIIAVPVGLARGKKVNRQIYGDEEDSEVKEERVKILVRRCNPYPLAPTVQVNTVVFETSTGERIELAIKDLNTYNTMIEGDEGILCHQGKRFIEFRRDQSC